MKWRETHRVCLSVCLLAVLSVGSFRRSVFSTSAGGDERQDGGAGSSSDVHQGGCLTGLGEANRIRGHSGSYSHVVIFHPPITGEAALSEDGDPSAAFVRTCVFYGVAKR